MHGAGAGALRRLDQRLDLEVALGGRRRPDQVRLVGVRDVQGGRDPPRNRRRPSQGRARAACGRRGSRSRPGWRPAPCRTWAAAVFSPLDVPRRPVDRRSRPIGADRGRALRLGLPRSRVLGDRGLLCRDGDRLLRREARAAARTLVSARLAARPDRGQGARARDDGDARRARASCPRGWSPRSSCARC